MEDVFGLLSLATLLATLSIFIARKLFTPPVVIEMLLGISVGVFLTSLGKHTTTLMLQINTIATLIGCMLCFSAGVESKSEANPSFRTAVFSLISVPLSLAASYGFFLFYDPAAAIETKLFMTICFMVTAVPVLLRLIGDRRSFGERTSTLALQCACWSDIFAWITFIPFSFLALEVSPEISAGSLNIAIKIVLFILSILFFRKIVRGLSSFSATTVFFTAIFVSGYISILLQAPPYLGIFIMGMALGSSRTVRETNSSIITPAFGGLIIVYFFSCSFGIDLGTISINILVPSIIAIVIGFLVKLIQCVSFGWILNLRTYDSIELGILLNSRGLMEIVFLIMGREIGLINDELFAIFVLMALGATALTPVLLKALSLVFNPKRRRICPEKQLV